MKRITSIASALVIMLHLFSCEGNEEVLPLEPNSSYEIEKFGKILDQKISISEEITRNIYFKSDLQKEYEPLINQAKILISSYGITEAEIEEYFENPNDPRLGIVGLLIYTSESSERMQHAGILSSFFYNQQWECIAEAIGVPSALIAGNMKKMTVKAILKSVAKMSGRVLGYIGLAWAIADYTSCMGYW